MWQVDSNPEETDVRDMIPWLIPESRLLIGMAEDHFTSKLAVVGNDSYLGNLSTFQLLISLRSKVRGCPC
jgi:hypothetical protein